jgi:hypothetical protein
VSWKGSPLFRDLLGFLAGGVNAAMASALLFLAFHPPDAQPKRHNHTYQTSGERFWEKVNVS